ncbi:ABC transporter substrate-binding protein [Sinomonas humi]|uniref:ABC transporter substrate-binding protein n=1 Tax=Sinomonas humi TaxID=1338436 RepID=A0A0B2APF4_9MICC|nr:ABC transporter substrate-binding protein [Sinomonas humi]KHL03832.1 ABC transporter substrate-binding protein [Sinomonas humi]
MKIAHALRAGGTSLALAAAMSGCSPSTSSTTDNGGRIRLAMLQPPRSGLTPFSDDAFKLSRWATAETLVTLDENGEALPHLAAEWKRVGDKAWEFILREDVEFHDGTKLTAAAVANTLVRATKAAPKPRILDGVQLTAEAEGEHRVRIATAAVDPLLPQRLSSPQLAILAESAYRADGTVSPVGTGSGPFKLVAVNGTSTATLDRFDRYWGKRSTAAGIDVSFVPDGTARGAALRTDSADVVEAIPVSQAPLLDSKLIHEVPMPRTNTLYLNNATGPFSDPGLRAAARKALNPGDIVKSVYEGRADVAAGLLGPALPWAAALRASSQSISEPGSPAGAKIRLGTFSDRAELPEVAVLVEQQLEAAGFVVEQVVREYAHFEKDMLAGAFDAVILSRATVLDSGDPVAYMFSDFSCKGSFNIAHVCDQEIDRALEKASSTEPGPERRAAVMAAEAEILKRDVAIPMLHERVIQGEATGVSGVARDPRERALIMAQSSASRGAH